MIRITVKQTRGNVIAATLALLLAAPTLCGAGLVHVSRVPRRSKLIQSRLPVAAQEAGRAGNAESPEFTAALERIFTREKQLWKSIRTYSPRIETYIQNIRPDKDLGSVPTDDEYFLGRLDFQRHMVIRSLLPQPSLPRRIIRDAAHPVTGLYSTHYQQESFARTILLDPSRFDRKHYDFQFVRREFLGDIRCLVFDVNPQRHAGREAFRGRIWVEDQDYNIVRTNGTFSPPPTFSSDFHFDSWRENLQPGLWLPVYVYSEESDLKYGANRTMRFRSQTRLWGYDLTTHNRHQEPGTHATVGAPAPARKSYDTAQNAAPVSPERQWGIEADKTLLQRLEEAGLLAPAGDEVEKILETVLNNIVLSNRLEMENPPPLNCRVLLTSSLESLFIGDTIVISRGLIDVLPDEASLAMIESHELGHIVLRHNWTAKGDQYTFKDRLLVPDEDVLQRLDLRLPQEDEAAADSKGIELLKHSPYKDKLDKAGLFLRAVAATAPRTPQLFGAHLGNRLARGNHVRHMAELMSSAPELKPERVDQIAALPLGARVKVDAWSDRIRLMKSKPVTLLWAREKMPFEVTPLFPHLVRVSGRPQNVREETLPH